MIPDCVAAMRARHVVPQEFAATGAISVVLEPDALLEAVRLLDRAEYLLEDVMASDVAEGFELAYHFSLFSEPSRVVLRLIVPRDAPEVPSIAGVYAGADWHERECFDFYGLNFVGHPNLHPLLLPEDFEGHPLVKPEGARKSLRDLLPEAFLAACGLAEPEPAGGDAPADDA